MSLFIRKHAIESNSAVKSGRKSRKRSKREDRPTTRRICRVEELEKREYLSAEPVSVGVVYAEQYQEELGDLFYVAWVGGENGAGTTLDSLVINLDKNGNGHIDNGEPFFDTTPSELGVYASVPFTVVEKSPNVEMNGLHVEDGGLTLEISFSNFHEGDYFIFKIDLDEFQTSPFPMNPQVEGSEMGGSVVGGIEGARIEATFSSNHYQTEVWSGMFVDKFDQEFQRSIALSNEFTEDQLPYDSSDDNNGIGLAGVYADVDLTPKPIIISGTVYADHNVNCNYEPELNDEPLAGVEVTLVSQDGRKWTTTTDVNGYYQFNDNLMPGDYEIFSEDNIVSPEGWQYFDFCAKGGNYGTKISPLQINVDGMEGGEHASNNNFAKSLVSTIDGYVFEDLNNANGKEYGEEWDGVAYPAEIQLWQVNYDSNGNKSYVFMESQNVDANGYYKFVLDGSYGASNVRKLPTKTYEVREIFSSPDYSDGKDYPGSLGGVALNDVITDIYVGYGQNGYHYDFGELKLGSIAGNVYEDRNDNGVKNVGEPGIANVRIDLYRSDGAGNWNYQKTAYTDENGNYLFEDLDINCDYAVKEWQPDDYDEGKYNAPGSLGGAVSFNEFSEIRVGWDDHGRDYNFGELKLGSIAGNVYEDRNDNGVKDPLEGGISNVQIDLYKWDGADYALYRSTKTDADGNYSFDKLPINEQYAVKEHQPIDYADGKDNAPGTLGGNVSNDAFSEVNVGWDDHGEDYNFGELKLGAISGYVYHDANDNGLREPELGEKGIAGATVELWILEDGEYKKINETITNEFGFYEFTDLDIERTYAVKEIQPEDWADGKDREGTLGGYVKESDHITDIPVAWNDYGEEYDFGELVPTGSLSGFVYEDDNDNGIMEENEAGIENVRVELYRVGDDGAPVFVDFQLTNKDGFYYFGDLKPDETYVLHEIQPTAYYDGKDTVGTIFGAQVGDASMDDYLFNIELPRNGHGINYNFGELRPASISGFVYYDVNDNGIKESGEPGIAGASVALFVLNPETGKYENTGETAVTDGNGHYVFDNLKPMRVYKLVETQPANYLDGKDSVGSLGGVIESSDRIADINVKPGDVGVEYNFGELKQDRDYPPPPNTPPVNVPPNLWAPSPTMFPYIWYQPVIPGSMTTLYGGGGGFTEEYTWKLSVFNGTSPRSNDAIRTTYGFRANQGSAVDFQTVSYKGPSVDGIWILQGIDREVVFGVAGAKPVVGDWTGSGKDCIGLYDGGNWLLNIDLENDGENKINYTAELGKFDDVPVVGDWDGDGKADLGVFGKKWTFDDEAISIEPGLASDFNTNVSVVNGRRAKNVPPDQNLFAKAREYMRKTRDKDTGSPRLDLIDHVFSFGAEGDVPIVGDWNGDGVSEIGVYSKGVFYLDRNGDGIRNGGDLEITVADNLKDFTPVVGDWNGDGFDTVGLFKDGYWRIAVSADGQLSQPIKFGEAGDVPVVGDWNGDGVDEFGVYRPYQPSDEPLEVNSSPEFEGEFALH